jgi:hypothetical protein
VIIHCGGPNSRAGELIEPNRIPGFRLSGFHVPAFPGRVPGPAPEADLISSFSRNGMLEQQNSRIFPILIVSPALAEK